MAEYFIQGGKSLEGAFTVHGAKNAALPILAASLLSSGENEFYQIPEISDVKVMQCILEHLGCRVTQAGGAVVVDSGCLCQCQIPEHLMKQMRSSVFLVGPLLARCGKAVISQPGGCCIGKRPIDLHIKALEQMGVRVDSDGAAVTFTATELTGANIVLEYPSVGATENVMMAAVAARGETVIYNCAREPEIIDLQNYLNCCGARIRGAGTSRIVIRGGGKLHGCSYKIMGDRIEAGTFLMAAAGTGGQLEMDGIDPLYLKTCIRLLRFSGCKVKRDDGRIWLKAPERLYGIGKIQTGPYPGFPTDLQPQMTAVMTAAAGMTQMEETVFENRFGYTRQLIKMGADIEIFHRVAIIKGKDFLQGNRVAATDLRGGAALVLAGLMSRGNTVVENVEFIERGYCDFHKALRKLGADIDRCI